MYLLKLFVFFFISSFLLNAQSQISKECEKLIEGAKLSDRKSCIITKESFRGYNKSLEEIKKQGKKDVDAYFVQMKERIKDNKYLLKGETDPEKIELIKEEIKQLEKDSTEKQKQIAYDKLDEAFKILKAYPYLKNEDIQIFQDTLKLCKNQKFINYGKLFFKQALHSFTSLWDITDLFFTGSFAGLVHLKRRTDNNLLSENFTKKMSSPGFSYALNECFPGKVDGSLMNPRIYFFTAGLIAETIGNFANIYILFFLIPKAIIYARNLARFGILKKTKFKNLKELTGIVSPKRITTYKTLKYSLYAGLGLTFIPVFYELRATYQILESAKKQKNELFGGFSKEKQEELDKEWKKTIIKLQKQTIKKAKRVLKLPLIEQEEREELLEKLSLLGEKGPDYVELFKKTRISYRSLIYKEIKSVSHFEDFYKNIEKKYQKVFKREIGEEAPLEAIKKFRKSFYKKYIPYYQIRLDLENKKLQENLKNKHSSCLKEACLFTKKDFHRLFNYITEEEREVAENAMKDALKLIDEES